MYTTPLGSIKKFWLYSKRRIFSERNRVSRGIQLISQNSNSSKILIAKKKRDQANKLKKSVFENPKRFWSYVKSSTRSSQSPNFLRNGQTYTTDSREKANLLNAFFHSVFNPCDVEPPAYIPTPSETLADNQLSKIELFVEVAVVLSNLDPNKASGADGIPCRLLKEVAHEIAPSLCSLFNFSLSLGVVPTEWNLQTFPLSSKKRIQRLNLTTVLSLYSVYCRRYWNVVFLTTVITTSRPCYITFSTGSYVDDQR